MATSPNQSEADDPNHRKWKRRFGPIVVVLTGLALAAFVFSLLGRYFFLAELLGNFRLHLGAWLSATAVIALATRSWKCLGLLVAATLWASLGTLSVYLPTSSPATDTAHLRILSFNVLGKNLETALVRERIREIDADVVVVLEYANHWHDALSELKKEYPYRIHEPRWHGFGIALFSKLPFTDQSVRPITSQHTDNPVVGVKLLVEGQYVQLFGVHTVSPINPDRMRLRNQQLKELAKIVQRQECETIIVGDFNCTPWSPFLSDFLKETGLRDSRQGFGYQPSWHADFWPLRIPIDHAFVSEAIQVHRRKLEKPAGSDHLPLVIDISVAPSK